MSYNPHLGEPNAFIEEHMGLVHKVARQFDNMSGKHGITDDDLVSIGSIGLWKAYRTFDPSLGYKWSTYATNCVRNALTDAYREYRKQMYAVSLDEALSIDETGDIATRAEFYESDYIDDSELSVASFIASLDDRYRMMLEMRLDGMGQREISEVVGINQSNVSRKLKRMARKYLSGDWTARAV